VAARKLGYTEKLTAKPNGQLAFRQAKGNKAISYDVDGHNGRAWKQWDNYRNVEKRQRDRTMNFDLTRQIKK